MSDFSLRPLQTDELASLANERNRYEGYARLAKIVMIVCALAFGLSLITIPELSSDSHPFSFMRYMMFIGLLYNGLFIAFMIALGVWLWGRYMVQNRSFVDERKVGAKWLPLVKHDRYQTLKAAQGGVFQFQFEQMKERGRW